MRPAVTGRPAPSLETYPVHLGPGASAIALPAFPPDERAEQWYADYGSRFADDMEGRLVSQFRFDAAWDSWEMHPRGAELIICTAGSFTLVQQSGEGEESRTELTPGTYAVNPPGIWHTVDAPGPAAAIFVTPGLGTTHRRR